MPDDPIPQLADALRATGEAHHQAFIATDGADPEWPLWYADHLQPIVSDAVGKDVTRAQIVWALVDAERSVPAKEPWPTAYAHHIVDTLGGSAA
jgi:NAD(P)H-hydrate epimerase